jgi:hypothetical protein
MILKKIISNWFIITLLFVSFVSESSCKNPENKEIEISNNDARINKNIANDQNNSIQTNEVLSLNLENNVNNSTAILREESNKRGNYSYFANSRLIFCGEFFSFGFCSSTSATTSKSRIG